MKKVIRIYLYTDDLKIIDAVFAYTLTRNIRESGGVELFRKRENDDLNSIFLYDLVIMDHTVSDYQLTKIGKRKSLPCIFRVIRSSEDIKNSSDKAQNLEFGMLKNSLHLFERFGKGA